MPTDLPVRRGTPTYTSAKFGNGLSGGVVGTNTSPNAWDSAEMTVEAWVKITNTTGTRVAIAWGGSAYMGVNGDKFIVNSSTATAYVIGDGAWHHIAFTRHDGGMSAWVDGQGPITPSTYATSLELRVGGLGNSTSFDWTGQIDEVRVSSVARYTAPFTPTLAAFTVDADTVDLYHLEADGTSGDPTAADTTDPTPGTLAVVTTSTTADLTVTGAADETALDAAPYAYSSDNGATWTAYQASATYEFTGLTASTSYTFQHRVKDAAGNVATGTAVTESTAAPSGDTTSPTAGTLAASSITDTGFTLTVTGASDETALDAAPYAFSTDNGGTYSAWQASNVYAASGLTAETAYDCVHKVRDAAANEATGTAIEVTTEAAATAVPGSPTDSNILYSPANWNVTESGAVTVNAGAYMRFAVAATSITLNFDTTNYDAQKPARIKYRVDDAGWIKVTVTSSVPLTIPTTNTWDVHTVEVVVAYAEEGYSRWTAPLVSHVTFTGMTLSEGGTTRPIQPKPISGIIFGDSITEGVRNLKNNDYGQGEDATVAWSYLLGDFAGAEVGVVGFGGQRWTLGGNGGVPAFTTSYASIYDGVPRDFTGLDFVAVNMGANQTPTVATVTAWLASLMAAIPSTCQVLVMRPFGGQAAANLATAVTTFDNARVTYVDTTGWWSTADSYDALHPYGHASIESLAPRLAAAVRSTLTAAPTPAVPTRFYRATDGTATPIVTG